ncbi:hypothetical protein SLA2020_324090 [Shorea laevis]
MPSSSPIVDVPTGPLQSEQLKKSGSWVELIQPKKPPSFHPPTVSNGKTLVKPPRAVCEAGIKVWEDCLIGTFVDEDDAPNYGRIVSMANRIWGRKCQITIIGYGKNTYLFKIPDLVTQNWVLNSRPRHVAHKTLVMRKWVADFKGLQKENKKLPIWLKLWGVPMDLFIPEGLGYVASSIGVPLSLEKATEKCAHIEFAKVCVEVDIDVTTSLPKGIIVDDEEGFPSEIVKVEYPWLPVTCTKCHRRGHVSSAYKGKELVEPIKRKEWIPITKKKDVQTNSSPVKVPEVKAHVQEVPAATIFFHCTFCYWPS